MKTVSRIIASVTILALTLGVSITSAAEGKLSVRKGIIVSATSDVVWDLLGDYNSMEVWHPAVLNSILVGDGVTAGSRRLLIIPGVGTIAEELISHSDETMTLVYRIIDSPLPITNYVSTLQVEATRDPKDKTSKILWTSTFDAKGDAPEEQGIEIVTGVYKAGLEAVRQRFE